MRAILNLAFHIDEAAMNRQIALSASQLEQWKQEVVLEVSARMEELLAKRGIERAVGREEMAEILGVGLATIDRLVRDKVIPSMTPCNRRLFLPSKVFEALEAER
ncbi:MAG: helix-turn-helix domain-containing protein [Planctomycetota bacterium]